MELTAPVYRLVFRDQDWRIAVSVHVIVTGVSAESILLYLEGEDLPLQHENKR